MGKEKQIYGENLATIVCKNDLDKVENVNSFQRNAVKRLKQL